MWIKKRDFSSILLLFFICVVFWRVHVATKLNKFVKPKNNGTSGWILFCIWLYWALKFWSLQQKRKRKELLFNKNWLKVTVFMLIQLKKEKKHKSNQSIRNPIQLNVKLHMHSIWSLVSACKRFFFQNALNKLDRFQPFELNDALFSSFYSIISLFQWETSSVIPFHFFFFEKYANFDFCYECSIVEWK